MTHQTAGKEKKTSLNFDNGACNREAIELLIVHVGCEIILRNELEIKYVEFSRLYNTSETPSIPK